MGKAYQASGMNAILNNLIYFEDGLTIELKGASSQCFDKCGDFDQSTVEYHFNNWAYILEYIGGNQLQTYLYEKVV